MNAKYAVTSNIKISYKYSRKETYLWIILKQITLRWGKKVNNMKQK